MLFGWELLLPHQAFLHCDLVVVLESIVYNGWLEHIFIWIHNVYSWPAIARGAATLTKTCLSFVVSFQVSSELHILLLFCYAVGHFPLSWHWGLVLRASRISIVLKACDPGSLFALFLSFFQLTFGAISVYVAHGVAVLGYGTGNIYLIAIRMVIAITASSIFALWSCCSSRIDHV